MKFIELKKFTSLKKNKNHKKDKYEYSSCWIGIGTKMNTIIAENYGRDPYMVFLVNHVKKRTIDQVSIDPD